MHWEERKLCSSYSVTWKLTCIKEHLYIFINYSDKDNNILVLKPALISQQHGQAVLYYWKTLPLYSCMAVTMTVLVNLLITCRQKQTTYTIRPLKALPECWRRHWWRPWDGNIAVPTTAKCRLFCPYTATSDCRTWAASRKYLQAQDAQTRTNL